MFARIERLYGPLNMHVMRQGNIDRINVRICDESVIAHNRSASGGEVLKRGNALRGATGDSR